MYENHDPNWLRALSRHLRWLAIPNIAIIFVLLQTIGFFLISARPEWFERLALIPGAVLEGEVWRLITFLCLPIASGIIGMLFALTFGFFILNSIENEWGSFKATFYVLLGLIITASFAFVFDYPVTSVTGFVATWFLAAATLFPENQIQLYFFIPVKMKFLGFLAALFALYQLLTGGWVDRFYLIAIYTNYFVFFTPYLIYRFRQWRRRREFRSNWKK